MGIDPGYKNGCKCAIINKIGRKIDTFKISVETKMEKKGFVNPPEGKKPMNDKGKYYKNYYPSESWRESSVTSSASNGGAFMPPMTFRQNRKRDDIPDPKRSINILIDKIKKYKVDVYFSFFY